MEAAYDFAKTITVSEITPNTCEVRCDEELTVAERMELQMDDIPTVDYNLKAGDYILL